MISIHVTHMLVWPNPSLLAQQWPDGRMLLTGDL